ncbi:hypothetical protein BDY17DRAFT_247235 [Neohortaea acidophila]|uniref:DUF159 domain protein n=1 Tax=Neohortaea acidophila TaxID=245834 RepID=A0A6A6PZU4_9PEZI|nr:uncharacterized protein BDY17DRAFT_247235 [Neohortaea acidophila]KAF2485259.1 hypothetical protein BDY17DRAFT_247235 [Neohortaea acidophila]
MCGRYVLAMRPSQVRQHLEEHNMPTDEAPSDEDGQLRQSYNFAPGYHGLIYRAATNDRGTNATPREDSTQTEQQSSPRAAPSSQATTTSVDGLATRETKYKLQAAKWGLIPFWTKRSPDYGSMLRTINCRDDSLIENRGMWNTMKQRKRCIVVAEGFYEWLKKNGGKEKIPHFVKRKDGRLMCLAGLWDCVQYEDTEEKLYTYTIITTDSNRQLRFLHDRMPVLLEAGSEQMAKWLDPGNVGWNKELQDMLKPFSGELECYPVDQAVGKVGNNSPSFVIPVDSKANKKNIANFFDNQKASPKKGSPIKVDKQEDRATAVKVEDIESNAPLPKPRGQTDEQLSQAIKEEGEELDDSALLKAEDEENEKGIKRKMSEIKDEDLLEAESSPAKKAAKPSSSPIKPARSSTRSATSNATVPKTPTKAGGNAKITSFFGK